MRNPRLTSRVVGFLAVVSVPVFCWVLSFFVDDSVPRTTSEALLTMSLMWLGGVAVGSLVAKMSRLAELLETLKQTLKQEKEEEEEVECPQEEKTS